MLKFYKYFNLIDTFLYTILMTLSLWIGLNFTSEKPITSEILSSSASAFFGFVILLAFMTSLVRIKLSLYGLFQRNFNDGLLEVCILVISISMLSVVTKNTIYLDGVILPMGFLIFYAVFHKSDSVVAHT